MLTLYLKLHRVLTTSKFQPNILILFPMLLLLFKILLNFIKETEYKTV